MANFYPLDTYPTFKPEPVEDGLNKYAWLMISLWGFFYMAHVLL